MVARRIVCTAVAAIVAFIARGTAARGADMSEQARALMELHPGMTKIVPVPEGRTVQAIVIGNPNIADASAINLGAIAVTGKGIGFTNFILFDSEGKVISDTKLQVVDSGAYEGNDNARERHEVRVISLWKGPGKGSGVGKDETPKDRRFLCADSCSTIQIDEPPALNPPGTTNAPIASTSTWSVTSPLPQGAPAPQGVPLAGPGYAQ